MKICRYDNCYCEHEGFCALGNIYIEEEHIPLCIGDEDFVNVVIESIISILEGV